MNKRLILLAGIVVAAALAGIQAPNVGGGGKNESDFFGLADLIGVAGGDNFAVGINADDCGELRAFFRFIDVALARGRQRERPVTGWPTGSASVQPQIVRNANSKNSS